MYFESDYSGRELDYAIKQAKELIPSKLLGIENEIDSLQKEKIGKDSLPTKNSQLDNDCNYISQQDADERYVQKGGNSSDGGYYTPVVIQIDDTTAKFEFIPSEATMPDVEAVTLTLPRGAAGDKGDNGYTPQRGTDYWTEADKAEIIEEATPDLSDYVKNTDYATADKGGTVKVTNYSSGLSMTSDGRLQIYGAEQPLIKEKASYYAPITAKNADYAIAQGTHQDMGDEYDVTAFFTIPALVNDKGQLPVSYNAVKGYVDKKIGDIDTALDSIIAEQESIIAMQNSLIGGGS